jgi:hypothetical protein
MLSEIDARVFDFNGINYDEEVKKEKVRTSKKMDKWTYDDYIKPIRELLIEQLKVKFEEAMKEKSFELANNYKYRLEELEKEEAED